MDTSFQSYRYYDRHLSTTVPNTLPHHFHASHHNGSKLLTLSDRVHGHAWNANNLWKQALIGAVMMHMFVRVMPRASSCFVAHRRSTPAMFPPDPSPAGPKPLRSSADTGSADGAALQSVSWLPLLRAACDRLVMHAMTWTMQTTRQQHVADEQQSAVMSTAPTASHTADLRSSFSALAQPVELILPSPLSIVRPVVLVAQQLVPARYVAHGHHVQLSVDHSVGHVLLV